jgi:uncharacterized protein (TIGR02391 family)
MTERSPGVKEVATLADGSLALECAFCEGTGVMPDLPFGDSDRTATEPCPVCKGTAINIIPGNSEASMTCRFCRATGRAWDENGYFNGEPCRVCSGMGFLDISALEAEQDVQRQADFWKLLHPTVTNVAKARFDAGHFADAVEAALKEFNAAVKRLAAIAPLEADGASLMTRVFSVERPILKLADLETESGRNMQKGYMQIFAGAMTGIRNPKAHDNLVISPERAMHFLFLASLCFFKLDEAQSAA